MHTSALISLALALTSNAFPLVSTPVPTSSAVAQRRSADYNVVNVGDAPDPQPIPTALETVVQTVTLPGAPAQTVTVTVPATPTTSPSSSAIWGSSAFSGSPAAYPVPTPEIAARGYSSSAAWGTSASGLVARAFSSPSSLFGGSSSELTARAYTPSYSSPVWSTSAPATPTVTPELAARYAAPSSSPVWSTSASAYPTTTPAVEEETAPRGLDRLARAFGRSLESQLKVIEGNLPERVKARRNETSAYSQLVARGVNATEGALSSRGLFNTTTSAFQARSYNGTASRA
ncbi:uncharacterized protein BDV14DRAFT_165159 [Aspergillus stella-maris]|uniref:uncharacterized protein n=1 Tax=Aspergillus stella-maris TaxID=1810926 RepID=UPI003CCCD083